MNFFAYLRGGFSRCSIFRLLSISVFHDREINLIKLYGINKSQYSKDQSNLEDNRLSLRHPFLPKSAKHAYAYYIYNTYKFFSIFFSNVSSRFPLSFLFSIPSHTFSWFNHDTLFPIRFSYSFF